jgi:hypothetical protein
MHSQGFGGIIFERMQIVEEVTGRVEGFDLLEDIGHVWLQGPGGVPFRNMHSHGFGVFIIQRMQIFEKISGRVWGV